MLYQKHPYQPYKSNFNSQRHLYSKPFNKYKKTIWQITSIALVVILIIFINSNKTHKNQSTNEPQALSASIKSFLPILPTITPKSTLVIAQRKADINDPYIPAKNIFLLDSENSYPLYEKNSHDRVPIASITKIMTAIVALDNYDLNQIVTVPQSAATIAGSRMKLSINEKITVQNLLYGLLLDSGNDAAYALASLETTAKKGDIKPFVEKMNQKAQLLGLNNTFFYCPAGLDDKGYSTAHDLAYLTAFGLRNKTFSEIILTAQKTVFSSDGKYRHDLINTNRLVVPTETLYLPSAIGGKTGYTELAGHSLVAAAKQDGHTLISVVLNTYNPAKPESARLSKELLTWGLASFQWTVQ
ncbi:MAG: hypothetical protein Q7S37_02590 [bacterium]|nr:hypothetical protein [bacterium]